MIRYNINLVYEDRQRFSNIGRFSNIVLRSIRALAVQKCAQHKEISPFPT
jgi:hypothetical protein